MLSLIIDGYNLLHAIEKGFINSLQDKREDLITKLHHYQLQKKIEITVVFDGAQPEPGYSNRDRFGHVDIVYTNADTTADEWISDACEKSPGSYVVVSSDNAVARAAERYGCIALSSEEYIRKLSSSIKVIDNPYLEDKEDDETSEILYPRVTTKKKGVAKRLPKRDRKKFNQLKNL